MYFKFHVIMVQQMFPEGQREQGESDQDLVQSIGLRIPFLYTPVEGAVSSSLKHPQIMIVLKASHRIFKTLRTVLEGLILKPSRAASRKLKQEGGLQVWG